MPGLYDDAAIYDTLYTPGTAAEVDALERVAHDFAPRRPLVWLEPACGSGRYLRVLAARGHRVVGFDRSTSMLEYARRNLHRRGLERRARLFCADMEQRTPLAAGTIDVAFNLVNTIRHLEGDAAMLRHLREVARLLRPGGIYAIGISLTAYGVERPDEDVWVARRGRRAVRQVIQYLPPGTWPASPPRSELVVSHLTITRPSGVELQDSKYLLRCYDADQWRRLLARSPLRLAATVDAHGAALAARSMPYGIDVLRR